MSIDEIKVSPTPFQEVVSLLRSQVLQAVEEEIALQLACKVIRDESTAATSYTQAEISVSGMSPNDIENFLKKYRDKVISFGVRFLRDEEATKEVEEYPEGEEQDESEDSVDLGLGSGFGIKYAIYYNFLANRSPQEFLAFLKNRRIPKHAQFAKELQRVFDEGE